MSSPADAAVDEGEKKADQNDEVLLTSEFEVSRVVFVRTEIVPLKFRSVFGSVRLFRGRGFFFKSSSAALCVV